MGSESDLFESLPKVLIVDDDVGLSELLVEYLEPEGFRVRTASDGEAGVVEALSGKYDIAVLDVMLPGINGFEALRRIRERSTLPVLMLTAKGEDLDRIRGLEVGADDYLAKPFNTRELIARIRAILRRTRPKEERAPELLSIGDIVMDTGARTVRRAGEVVELTGGEFDLLEVLLRTAGRVVRREELARAVLGRELAPLDRSIDVHVSHLRGKLGAQVEGVERIKAIRGVGYLYATVTR
jgi:DNA-binding response OmpR family regulator